MSKFHTRKAYAVLVADPDCPPDLLEFAQDLLITGGISAQMFSTTGPRGHYEEVIEGHIAEEADLVVVLRTEQQPSREVLATARLAKAHGKAVHALVLVGVESYIDADESHPIEVDPSWDLLEELYSWGAGLARRYGRPT